eukprot:417905_1
MPEHSVLPLHDVSNNTSLFWKCHLVNEQIFFEPIVYHLLNQLLYQILDIPAQLAKYGVPVNSEYLSFARPGFSAIDTDSLSYMVESSTSSSTSSSSNIVITTVATAIFLFISISFMDFAWLSKDC